MSNGPITRPRTRPRIGLVLGGGALKGFAHLGALRALQEAGLRPRLYSGSSIGALIAAGHVGGMDLEDMIDRAMRLRRKDLFRINHVGMLLERMQSPSIYLEGPLRDLCDEIAPAGTFEDVTTPLLVTAVGYRARCACRVWTSGAQKRERARCRICVVRVAGIFPAGSR